MAIELWYNALRSAPGTIESFSVCDALECCEEQECSLEEVLDPLPITEVIADITAYLIGRLIVEGRLVGTRAARRLFRDVIRGIVEGTAPN